MIRTGLIAAFALIATPALAQETPRYTLTVSVVQQGVQVVETTTQIIENVPASASVVTSGASYFFEANLFAVQGDGDDSQLSLEAHLVKGTEEIAAPTLSFLRGQPARIEVSDERGDVLTMTVTPLE